METKPRFPLPSIEGEERQSHWETYSSLALLYEAKLFHLTRLRDLSKETMEIYWTMRDLTNQKEVVIHSTQRVESLLYSDRIERLVHRVIMLVQSEVLQSPQCNGSIFVLFGNAALFHIYIFMRDFPGGYKFYDCITTRLQRSIEAADLVYLQKEYPEMMLWILLMGGLGSSSTADRQWYAKLLVEACVISGLRGVNNITSMLAEFLWTELYRSPTTFRFWNDVTKAQGVDNGYEVRRLPDHISVASFNSQLV
jgi:hypothetical protein